MSASTCPNCGRVLARYAGWLDNHDATCAAATRASDAELDCLRRTVDRLRPTAAAPLWSQEHQPVPGFEGWHYALGKGGPCWYVALDVDGYTHAILTPDGNVAASRAPMGVVRWLLDNAPIGEALRVCPVGEECSR